MRAEFLRRQSMRTDLLAEAQANVKKVLKEYETFQGGWFDCHPALT